MAEDMDLIVAVQRSQFLALQQMEQRRKQIAEIKNYAQATNTTPYFFNATTPPQQIDPLAQMLHANPCLLGHKPAFLVSGGVACGVCGAPLT